jgi:hypothetical protein
MSSEIRTDLIKDKSNTKTLATLSSSAVTLSADVALATDNKNNNAKVSVTKTSGGAEYFSSTATEIWHTNFRVTLPSVAGTYFVIANLRIRHDGDYHDGGAVYLYTAGSSSTNGSEAVSNSKRITGEIAETEQGVVNILATPSWVISGTAGQVLCLYGQCSASNLTGVFADTGGYSELTAVRLGA